MTPNPYQPQNPLGKVPQWIVRNILITQDPTDALEEAEVIRAIELEFPRDEMGLWGGHTWREIFTRARELLPDLPSASYLRSTESKRTTRRATFMGVRLLNPLTPDQRKDLPSRNPRKDLGLSHQMPPKNEGGARTCEICQRDISHLHHNTRKCRPCSDQQKIPEERTCPDCQADISHRHPNNRRCEDCTEKHVKSQTRTYRALPHVRKKSLQDRRRREENKKKGE